MSGISILNIAKDALLTHQTAINLTGANVANVDTPGYSRQRPIFQSVGTIDMGTGQVQIGVEIESIERIYDQFLEVQINDQMHDLGYNETRKEELEKIEIIFNETAGGGISELLNEFWNAWGDLSENPSGQAERLALVAVAENLTYMFRSYGNDLISIQDNANAKIFDLVNQINNYLTDIADINEKIMQMMSGTGETNDLLDKRSELMKQLAEIIDYQYIEDAAGSVQIFLSNGTSLVEDGKTWQLDVTANPTNSFYYDIVLADDPNEESINNVITGGQIAGLIDIRDTTAADYLNSLNNLTASFVNEINTQHRLGYDLDQNLGGDFFDPTMTEAKDMIVSSDILSDINKIGASATVNGDGDNAISMGAIKDQAVTIDGETTTFNNHYASFMARIGQDVADGSIRYNHSESLMSQLVNKQEGISGVSVDDEMINLMQYQMGYNAAAKLCSVADELIDTLLSLVE